MFRNTRLPPEQRVDHDPETSPTVPDRPEWGVTGSRRTVLYSRFALVFGNQFVAGVSSQQYHKREEVAQ